MLDQNLIEETVDNNISSDQNSNEETLTETVVKKEKVIDKSGDWILREILQQEKQRQKYGLEMIASENYVSKNVMMAMSNVFTNKYSEGYPGNKWYGGQESCEHLELLTQLRALKMFGVVDKNHSEETLESIKEGLEKATWSCNVQPLSGSPANASVMLSLLNHGDTILGMNLSAGGHLSHGFKSNFSGKYFNVISYGVKEDTHLIDYDAIEKLLVEKKPKMIILGFSAYTRNIDWKRVKEIVDKHEKTLGFRPLMLADVAHISGLIVGEQLENPLNYVDIITTTTHKTLRGPRGAIILSNKTRTITKQIQKTVDGKLVNENKDVLITGQINLGVFPGLQGGPHMNQIYAKCMAFGEALQPEFKEYAKKVIGHSRALANKLIQNGWKVITEGTDNHIVLFDVTKIKDYTSYEDGKQVIIYKDTGLKGQEAQKILEYIGISTNKNTIPFDNDTMNPSGIRLGTAAITTRGLAYKEIEQIADLITEALLIKDTNARRMGGIANAIKAICVKFPPIS